MEEPELAGRQLHVPALYLHLGAARVDHQFMNGFHIVLRRMLAVSPFQGGGTVGNGRRFMEQLFHIRLLPGC